MSSARRTASFFFRLDKISACGGSSSRLCNVLNSVSIMSEGHFALPLNAEQRGKGQAGQQYPAASVIESRIAPMS